VCTPAHQLSHTLPEGVDACYCDVILMDMVFSFLGQEVHGNNASAIGVKLDRNDLSVSHIGILKREEHEMGRDLCLIAGLQGGQLPVFILGDNFLRRARVIFDLPGRQVFMKEDRGARAFLTPVHSAPVTNVPSVVSGALSQASLSAEGVNIPVEVSRKFNVIDPSMLVVITLITTLVVARAIVLGMCWRPQSFDEEVSADTYVRI